MASATSFCTQVKPSDKEVFLSIGTIWFYNFIIISKCLHIVKKKQGPCGNPSPDCTRREEAPAAPSMD